MSGGIVISLPAHALPRPKGSSSPGRERRAICVRALSNSRFISSSRGVCSNGIRPRRRVGLGRKLENSLRWVPHPGPPPQGHARGREKRASLKGGERGGDVLEGAALGGEAEDELDDGGG